MKRTRTNQKGTAVILALILIAVLSVMAVSMMFLSQSEGWSSANYRLMSQARDGAEAGLSAGVAYIQNTYVPPTDATGDTDQISAYTISSTAVNGTNVLFNGSPVVLSADPNVSPNYNTSAAAKQTAFNTAYSGGKGTLAAGTTTVNYYSSAKLLSQTLTQPDGGATTGSDSSVQTWEVTGRGTVAGVQGAEVQVSAILDRDFSYTPGATIPGTPGTTTYTPLFAYAAFGDSDTCTDYGLQVSGGGNAGTDSYDSTPNYVGMPGPPAYDASKPLCNPANTFTTTNCQVHATDGGNIGTNGYMSISGGGASTVGGSLSTPRPGVGSCAGGAGTSSLGIIAQGETQLPAEVSYPTPPFPAGVPVTSQILPNSTTCPVSITAGCQPFNTTTCPGCSGAPPVGTKGKFLLSPVTSGCPTCGNYGNLSGTVVYLVGGTYNVNSISSNVVVVPGTGPVTINLTGCGGSSGTAACGAYDSAGGNAGAGTASQYMTAFPISPSNVSNPSGDATQLTISYGGPAAFSQSGNAQMGPMAVYAPNVDFDIGGTIDFFGAIIAKSVHWHGTDGIHYDRRLGTCIAANSDCSAITTAGTPATTSAPTTTPGNFTLRQFTWKKF